MKKIVFYILVTLFSIATFAQNNLTFIEANEAYNQGNYDKAVNLYEQILKTGNHSANLYFNLANSYYKLQKIGPSIYNYEKAFLLEPKNRDIQINYSYAKQARLDNIENLPKGFLSRFYGKLANTAIDFWAWLAVISGFIFVISFIFFYRSVYSSQRKVFFAIWCAGLLISIFSLVFSFISETYQNSTNYAIVYASEVTVQSEPNLRSEQLFKLHEGTKVQVVDIVDNWKKILLLDGRVGWIPKKEILDL